MNEILNATGLKSSPMLINNSTKASLKIKNVIWQSAFARLKKGTKKAYTPYCDSKGFL